MAKKKIKMVDVLLFIHKKGEVLSVDEVLDLQRDVYPDGKRSNFASTMSAAQKIGYLDILDDSNPRKYAITGEGIEYIKGHGSVSADEAAEGVKKQTLKKLLGVGYPLTVVQACEIFPELKKTTVGWRLSSYHEGALLDRSREGSKFIYTTNENTQRYLRGDPVILPARIEPPSLIDPSTIHFHKIMSGNRK